MSVQKKSSVSAACGLLGGKARYMDSKNAGMCVAPTALEMLLHQKATTKGYWSRDEVVAAT
jgi:hypothetical protein